MWWRAAFLETTMQIFRCFGLWEGGVLVGVGGSMILSGITSGLAILVVGMMISLAAATALSRLNRQSLLVAAAFLLPLSASAAPILLVEIEQDGGSGDVGGVDQPIEMEFAAGPQGDLTSLVGEYTSADVGRVIFATPEQVDTFEHWLSQEDGRWIAHVSVAAPSGWFSDDLWQPTAADMVLRQFVPKLGVGLTGYDLTDVTQTIDQLEYIVQGNKVASLQQQTIRFFGEPLNVPEPAGRLLVLFCGLIQWRKRWVIT